MFKKTLFLCAIGMLCVVGLSAIAKPQLAPASQSATQPAGQDARITIHGSVTDTFTSDGISGIRITLDPVAARGGVAAQNPQTLRDAAQQAGLAPEAIERLVAQQAQRGALLANNTTESFRTESDSSGKFSLPNVPAGIYNLTASLEGYLYLPSPGAGSSSDTFDTQITVTAGQAVPDVSVRLVRGSTISGRISDASGRPASNVQVSALRLIYQQGRPILQSSASKTTDDRGEFRLFYLPPGEYYVAAGQPGAGRGAQAQRGAAITEAPVRTFYPREIEAEQASKIRVGAGVEIPGVNVTVQSARVFSVRGQATTTVPITPVTGPNGQLRGGQVSMGLSPRNRTLSEQTGTTVGSALDANGIASFQLTGVLPGDYYLVGRLNQPANPQGGAAASAANAIFARLPIDVRNDIEGVRFVIPMPVELKGNVVMSVLSATRPPNVRLNLINQNTYVAFPQYGRGQTQAAADGSFSFPAVPPGDYILDAQVPAAGPRGGDAYVSDIRMAGVSVIEKGFTIEDRAPPALEVVLSTGTGMVEGNVYSEARKPAPSASVVLVPVRRRLMPSQYRTANSDASGHFMMRGIPPGDYEVYCWEELVPTAAQDEEYLKRFKGKGQPVTVRAQAVSNADVTVIPRTFDNR